MGEAHGKQVSFESIGVVYAGGDPHLAREFARWIVDFDDRFVEEEEEGQGVLPDFVFSNETITLDEHHGESV